jgi:hypothetical protein
VQIPHPHARLAGQPCQCPESTGSRTPEAKTRVALNALRHGLKASIGHPLRDCSRTDDVPVGIAPRVAFRTKPECIRKQKGSENVIGPLRFHRGPARVAPIPHGARSADSRLPRPDGVSVFATRWEKQHDPIPRRGDA